MLREDATEDLRAATTRGGGGGTRPAMADLTPEAAARYEALRTWRLGEAREQEIPPYVIFMMPCCMILPSSARPRLMSLA